MRLLLLTLLLPAIVAADEGARLIIRDAQAWTGERLSFAVELRAEGVFSGAASFDIPEIPGTVVIRGGNPVLSSETDGDREVFVQRHEFSLFSQADGKLSLPPITARFSHKRGYTGPDYEVTAKTEEADLEIRRPPHSESLDFIVTTDRLRVEETWDPTPGPLEIGTVLKRTIVQHASETTGMALKPAPDTAPEGIRLYPGSPQVSDASNRGRLSGTRSDTLTYLVQAPGVLTIPAIRYDWWNPESEKLESVTLPAVTFTATAPPPPPAKPSPKRFLRYLVPAVAIGLCLAFRRRLTAFAHHIHQTIDPPHRRTERAFLRACRSGDPESANREWETWRTYFPNRTPADELARELLGLQRRLYGDSDDSSPWSGHSLALAFRQWNRRHPAAESLPALPKMNP